MRQARNVYHPSHQVTAPPAAISRPRSRDAIAARNRAWGVLRAALPGLPSRLLNAAGEVRT